MKLTSTNTFNVHYIQMHMMEATKYISKLGLEALQTMQDCTCYNYDLRFILKSICKKTLCSTKVVEAIGHNQMFSVF